MKKFILLFFAGIFAFGLSAQEEMTLEQLKAKKAEKQAAADALLGEVASLQGKIDTYPGWKFGGLGVLGFNLFDNKAWYSIPQAHSSQNSLGLGFTAFANYDKDKIFWRNNLIINMSKTNAKQFDDDATVETIADKLSITSLAGRKINDKLAISVEGSYVSSVLNFNDPGQLTVSAGVTWLPITDLVVVIHPIGYQLNFPDADFNSTAGAKIGATYTKDLFAGIKWNSALSAFFSYGEGENKSYPGQPDYSRGEMSNWTWENGLAFSAWKGIGVGLNLGLAGNKQLVDAFRTKTDDDGNLIYVEGEDDSRSENNPLQMYYNLGLSYNF